MTTEREILQPQPRLWLAFPVIAIALVAFAMGQTVLFVVLPPVARQVGLSEVQIGVMISTAALVIALISPWWGRRSDHWGRRNVLVFGLAAYAITTLTFIAGVMLGRSFDIDPLLIFGMLIGIRLIYALTTAGIQPAATAYIADLTTDRSRAAGLAMVGAAIGLGSVLGPVFGWLMSYFGLLAPLVGVSLLALCVAVAVLVLLPKRAAHMRSLTKAPALKFWDPRIMPYVLFMLIAMSVGTGAQISAGFYIIDTMGLDEMEAPRYVGIVMAAAAVAMLVAQGVVVQALRPSAALMVRVGIGIGSLGFVLLVFGGGNFPVILASFVAVGFALGFFNPGLMAAASLSVSAREQGGVAGLMGSAMAGGFVLGPTVGTWLYGLYRDSLPFQVSASVLAILFVISLFIRLSPRTDMAGADDTHCDDASGGAAP